MNLVDEDVEILTLRPLQILVAEDNTVNQMVIVKMLESVGHNVVVVKNGQEACDSLESHNFDLIVMDVHMPVMDGIKATKAIRGRGNSIPIIGCTAQSFSDEILEFIALGMNDIVVKPIRLKALLASFNKALGGDVHKLADGSELVGPIEVDFI